MAATFSDFRVFNFSTSESISLRQTEVPTAQSINLQATSISVSVTSLSPIVASQSLVASKIFSCPAVDFSTFLRVSFMSSNSSFSVKSTWIILNNAAKRCFIANGEGISHGSPRDTMCFAGTWSLRVNTFSTIC